MASKGFSTVSINIPKTMNHFVVAKILRRPVNIDLFSLDFGGFDFPFEYFDYAAFLNNSFELVPYRAIRVDVLKFVNRFLKNDSLLSISLYNKHSPENIEYLERGELIENKVKNNTIKNNSGMLKTVVEKGDFFYRLDNGSKDKKFRHLYDEDELKEDMEKAGFEVVEFTDNENEINESKMRNQYNTTKELNGKFIIALAKKVKGVKITRAVD
jgi:SAM-dependent methyltransferase